MKVDLKKEFPALYQPKNRQWEEAEVPALNFLMVDGQGDPNTSPRYAAAVEALYGVSYAIKFASKRELDRDYGVSPLEGLWWAEDMSAFRTRKKSDFQWTMMIMQPSWITRELVQRALESTARKNDSAALAELRFETFDEGRCLQVLHVGSYDDEGPTLADLHERILPTSGLAARGKHHEIYLSDPRRTETSRLKTILRQPVK